MQVMGFLNHVHSLRKAYAFYSIHIFVAAKYTEINNMRLRMVKILQNDMHSKFCEFVSFVWRYKPFLLKDTL